MDVVAVMVQCNYCSLQSCFAVAEYGFEQSDGVEISSLSV